MAQRFSQHALGNIADLPAQCAEPDRAVLQMPDNQHAPLVTDTVQNIPHRTGRCKGGIKTVGKLRAIAAVMEVMPPTPEAFMQALRDNKDAQKAWRLRPTPNRREILQSLNDKKTDAELAHGIAETIEHLLKKR